MNRQNYFAVLLFPARLVRYEFEFRQPCVERLPPQFADVFQAQARVVPGQNRPCPIIAWRFRAERPDLFGREHVFLDVGVVIDQAHSNARVGGDVTFPMRKMERAAQYL